MYSVGVGNVTWPFAMLVVTVHSTPAWRVVHTVHAAVNAGFVAADQALLQKRLGVGCLSLPPSLTIV